jgi:hypothetical protein
MTSYFVYIGNSQPISLEALVASLPQDLDEGSLILTFLMVKVIQLFKKMITRQL